MATKVVNAPKGRAVTKATRSLRSELVKALSDLVKARAEIAHLRSQIAEMEVSS
jgi:hypothetical protein